VQYRTLLRSAVLRNQLGWCLTVASSNRHPAGQYLILDHKTGQYISLTALGPQIEDPVVESRDAPRVGLG
jgi:hypothetical protein